MKAASPQDGGKMMKRKDVSWENTFEETHFYTLMLFLKKWRKGQRDGSAVKNSGCSCRGPGFNFLYFLFKIRRVKANGPVRNNFGYFYMPIWKKFKLFDLINVHNLLR